MDSPASRCFSARQAEFDTIAHFIESACGNLAQDARLRIVLLVEELFANSVNHGYRGDSDEPVWLSIGVGEASCRVVYEDRAPPYDPFVASGAATTDGDIEHRPIGGLGVVLLNELSSSRHYERRGERNVIELHIPHSPPSEAPAAL